MTKTSADHVIVTVHGIRTIGRWQHLLRDLLQKTPEFGAHTDVWSFSYGWFSAAALSIPWLRNVVVNRFARWMDKVHSLNPQVRITIVAHSFGTFVVTKALERLLPRSALQIETLLFCGSIVSPAYRWERWVPDRIRRVVNDCGTRDWIVVLCQLFVIGGGAAGRVGFVAMGSGHGMGVVNRYFELDHSGYFGGKTTNDFLNRYWLPLLKSPAEVVYHESRTGSAMSGALSWALNNSTPIKLFVYVTLISLGAWAVTAPARLERAARQENLYLDAAAALIATGNESAAMQALTQISSGGPRDGARQFLINVASRGSESWRKASLARFARSENGAHLVGFENGTANGVRWNVSTNVEDPLSLPCVSVDDYQYTQVQAVSRSGAAILLQSDSAVLCSATETVKIGADKLRFAADADTYVQWNDSAVRVADTARLESWRWQADNFPDGVGDVAISPAGRYVAIESIGQVTLYDTQGHAVIARSTAGALWWLWEDSKGTPAIASIDAALLAPCEDGADDCSEAAPIGECKGEIQHSAAARNAPVALFTVQRDDETLITCVSEASVIRKIGEIKLPAEAAPLAISADGSWAALISKREVFLYSLVTQSLNRVLQHPFPETAFFASEHSALIVTRQGCESGTCDDVSLPSITAYYPIPRLKRLQPEAVDARPTPADRLKQAGCEFAAADYEPLEPGEIVTTIECAGSKSYSIRGLFVDFDVSADRSVIAMQTAGGIGGSPSFADAGAAVLFPARGGLLERQMGVPGVFRGFPRTMFFGPDARTIISYGMSIAGSGGGAGASLEICAIFPLDQFEKKQCSVRHTRSLVEEAGPIVVSPKHDLAVIEVDERAQGYGTRLVLIDMETAADRVVLQTAETRMLAGAFSDDQSLVAALLSSGIVKVWETATGKALFDFRLLSPSASRDADVAIRCSATPLSSDQWEACEGKTDPHIAFGNGARTIRSVVNGSLYVLRLGSASTPGVPDSRTVQPEMQ